jgi:predicted transcriptional regulator
VLLEISQSPEQARYCERLNRKLKTSLTHLRGISRQLEIHQLIEIEKGNKIKHLILTEKGRRIAESLSNIKFELKRSLTTAMVNGQYKQQKE